MVSYRLLIILDIINRDIAPIIRQKEIIEDIAYFLCSYAAKLTSFSKLSNILSISSINDSFVFGDI